MHALQDGQEHCTVCNLRAGDKPCEYCGQIACESCALFKHSCKEGDEAKEQQRLDEIAARSQCVECAKPADRKCKQCGDLYCTVRWMGNPGCFENYHAKGNRTSHAAEPWTPAPKAHHHHHHHHHGDGDGGKHGKHKHGKHGKHGDGDGDGDKHGKHKHGKHKQHSAESS